MASFDGQAAGLGGVIAAFGGSDKPPVPIQFPGLAGLTQRAARLGRNAYDYLGRALPAWQSSFEQGTQRQLGLQNEQADILRGLTQRALARDPQQQLRETLGTLGSFIQPNVLDPLARFRANMATTNALARGTGNLGRAYGSTARRLADAAAGQRAYYDVAREVYGALPNVYNQVRNAGITDELLASGYIPQLQAGYRQIDLAPLIPLNETLNVTGGGIDLSGRAGRNFRDTVYGYHQPMNLADRFGAAGQSMWNTVKDAAQIYASLYGGGIGGGGATPTRPAATALPATGSPYYTGQPSLTAWA